jgi:ankyrin repeat protein
MNIEYVCQYGTLGDIESEIEDNVIIEWNHGLYGACRSGRKEVVELMIHYGADDWNLGLNGACVSGNRDVIELMMQNGADDVNLGLRSACVGGHLDIVKMMIDRGASNLNEGLRNACFYNNVDVVRYLVGEGAVCYSSLKYACYHGLVDIVRMLLDGGRVVDWVGGFFEACVIGERKIVDLFLERYDKCYKEEILYRSACDYRWIDLLCRTVCMHYSSDLSLGYDILDVFEKEKKRKVSDIKVKLFDVNLFGCLQIQNQRKRKRRK